MAVCSFACNARAFMTPHHRIRHGSFTKVQSRREVPIQHTSLFEKLELSFVSSSRRHLRPVISSSVRIGAAPGNDVSAEESPVDPETMQDMQDIQDIKFILEKLIETRDMTFNEVKLVMGIEDPRAKERRESFGVEDESGVSRDDIVYCLQQVHSDEIPDDRLSLRKCAEEMRAWPYLDLSEEMKQQKASGRSEYASITNTGVQVDLGDDDDDSPVPKWMGYGLLYAVSVIPIIIGVSAVIILFVNSLR